MRSALSFSRVTAALCVGALAVAGVVVNTHALDERLRLVLDDLPLIGSGTGSPFSRDCPDSHVLSGLRFRKGLVIDAVGIKCRPVRPDGSLGPEINSGSMAGGQGGTTGSVSCVNARVPFDRAIVAQQGAGPGIGINTLRLGCAEWFPASRSWGGSIGGVLSVMSGNVLAFVWQSCGSGTRPATGIRGRHGAIVDAFGLRCNAP